jgi:hypothetical protein
VSYLTAAGAGRSKAIRRSVSLERDELLKRQQQEEEEQQSNEDDGSSNNGFTGGLGER